MLDRSESASATPPPSEAATSIAQQHGRNEHHADEHVHGPNTIHVG